MIIKTDKNTYEIDGNSLVNNIIIKINNNNLNGLNHNQSNSKHYDNSDRKDYSYNHSNAYFHFINDILIMYEDDFYDHESRDGVDLSKGYENYILHNFDNEKSIVLFSNSYRHSSKIRHKYYGKLIYDISANFNFLVNVFENFSISEVFLEKYFFVINKNVINTESILKFIDNPQSLTENIYIVYDLEFIEIGHFTFIEFLSFLIFEIEKSVYKEEEIKEKIIKSLTLRRIFARDNSK